MKTYYPRIADEILRTRLSAKGAVLIEGAKWCGKTTTAAHFARSIVYMQDPDQRTQNIQAARMTPSLLLTGETPRLIDEWQIVPELWDAIRFAVDQRDEFGQFILTGSSTPNDQMSRYHSGTGRIARMTMRPMALTESGESTGSISLANLIDGKPISPVTSDVDIPDLAHLICRGGWPKTLGLKAAIALQQAFDYVDAVIESEISAVDGINRNPARARLLMRSYARHIGSDASLTALLDDMKTNERDSLSTDTLYTYVTALKRAFVIEDLPAWSPNLRSKTAIRTSDKHYYVDPSIGTAVLRLGPKDLLNDLRTMGFYYEALCVRDLRVYADKLDGDVFHYRDKSGLECDAVLHCRDGRYGLIEMKLGEYAFDDAAANLIRLRDKIDPTRMCEPSFLMILSGTRYAYQRDDGVWVVPIGCLGA